MEFSENAGENFSRHSCRGFCFPWTFYPGCALPCGLEHGIELGSGFAESDSLGMCFFPAGQGVVRQISLEIFSLLYKNGSYTAGKHLLLRNPPFLWKNDSRRYGQG